MTDNTTSIIAGDVFAFTTMPDAGLFIAAVIFYPDSRYLGCISMPDMECCTYTPEELFALCDSGLLERVDQLPVDVLDDLTEHYNNKMSKIKDLKYKISIEGDD